MDNSFQTSFIPKKSMVATPSKVAGAPKSLLNIISVFILIIVGLMSGGFFLYKSYLIKQKDILSSSLSKVKDSFDKDTITQLQLFDKRISISKQILSSHIVFSPMFRLLADLTIPNVQYTKFTEDATENSFTVKISGVAKDYKSVAIQANIFNTSKGRYFKDIIFSNLVRDIKNGYVTFDLDFTVDPELLSYEKNNLLEGSQRNITTTPINNNPQSQS